jgi:hypothetical protein
MANIASLASAVTNRLEEAAAPVFWNLQNELYPLIVEAMNLACLITGEPQFQANTTSFTIPASTSFAPIALPAGALALLRVDSYGTTIDKSYVQDLDNEAPGWEVATGPVPQYWMPFGLGQFGIYPNLTAPASVILSYVQWPVFDQLPYSGTEAVPFQQEYFDGFTDWAAGAARFKEGGKEFEEAIQVLNRALSQFESLSEFSYRKGSLRFSRGLGGSANIVETRVR